MKSELNKFICCICKKDETGALFSSCRDSDFNYMICHTHCIPSSHKKITTVSSVISDEDLKLFEEYYPGICYNSERYLPIPQLDEKTLLSIAIRMAADFHHGQMDKGGNPYILHPLRVMFGVAPDIEAMQVAVLHDVIEDCNIKPEYLISQGFSQRVVDAVVAVSREPAGTLNRRTYKEFIRDIKLNELAKKVKIADLKDNMNPERMKDLPANEKGIVHRYEKAMEILLEE